MGNNNFSELVYFLYGLSFYTMGICAWLLGSQKASAFTFVRSFKYLSYFGIIHGITEWMLMVLYMDFFPEHRTLYWQFITLLNILSFLFLWFFGIDLSNLSVEKLKLSKRLPFYALTIWLFIMILIVLFSGFDLPMTIRHESLISRYLIGFPASLTAAYALYKTSKQYIFKRIKSVNLQMLIMSGAFFLYGIFSGLIDLNLDFYPAKIINKEIFYTFTGVPVEIIRASLALIITAMFIQIIPIFKYENDIHLAHLKENQMINAERKRLSRTLHDGVLQELFVTGLELDGIKEDFSIDPKVIEIIDDSSIRIKESMVKIRQFISEVSHGDFEISDLILRLRNISESLSAKFETAIHIVDTIEDTSFGFLNQSTINNLFYIIQECIINALKHSGTDKIDVEFSATVDWIKIEIMDYGHGFDITHVDTTGQFGLKSIYERGELINSKILVNSTHKGTTVTITMPWEEENDFT